MKKFKFVPPYSEKGKTNFRASQNRSGVYLIKENGILVYVGFSAKNLYKTMYRHFQRWSHKTQDVITYVDKMTKNKYLVRIIYCTPKQAQYLEKALIKKHRPRDNYMQYEIMLDNYTPKENKYMEEVVDIYENVNVSYDLPF